ncbi:glycine betaine ABC transporter substrate-binding protein [Salinisphaera sp. RV14]|uniref:glycine betaine ABC transporter substrate-binding protein n=1 Tax=unclassified Salinisphaera TaxID=2649847 RepID=UPI003F82C985
MDSLLSRFLSIVVLGAVVLFAGCSGHQRRAGTHDPIVIGWTAWDDAEFVTRLAKAVIEDHTHHPVQLKLAGIGKQYRGVANGRLDAMLMAWLPDTHARYWQRYRRRLVDLGPLYQGGQLGWVVPDYVPRDRLNSIADLAKPDIAARLHHRIQGIDPGAGLMQLSKKALKRYGLNTQYRLAAADARVMSRVLARAEAAHKWVVVTGWTPHWIFGKWRLRFLQDPKGALGSRQHVDALVRDGFREDYPRVAAILSRMHLGLPELQNAMLDAQANGYATAVEDFMARHADQVAQWTAPGKRH